MLVATFERGGLTQLNSPAGSLFERRQIRCAVRKAVKGKELFEGKGNCIECHNGPVLSDGKFYNLGVPRPLEWEEMGINTITFRWENYAKGVPEKACTATGKTTRVCIIPPSANKMSASSVLSRCAILNYTPPYMHAGQFYTLEEVVDFYNEGGGDNEFTDGTHGLNNKTPILKPLNLTDEEKEALVAFLEEISGEEIKMAVPEVPPYGVMPDVPGLTQAQAKRIGLEMYLSSMATELRR